MYHQNRVTTKANRQALEDTQHGFNPTRKNADGRKAQLNLYVDMEVKREFRSIAAANDMKHGSYWRHTRILEKASLNGIGDELSPDINTYQHNEYVQLFLKSQNGRELPFASDFCTRGIVSVPAENTIIVLDNTYHPVF